MGLGDTQTAPANRSHPMDALYLAAGVGLFALFGLYALFLRRI